MSSLAEELANKSYPVLEGINPNAHGNIMEQFAELNNLARSAILEAVESALERAAQEADKMATIERNIAREHPSLEGSLIRQACYETVARDIRRLKAEG